MQRAKSALILVAVSISLSAQAGIAEMDSVLHLLAGAYNREGGNPKALLQVRCFLRQHGVRKFATKPAGGMASRCNQHSQIGIENQKVVALIDYTQTSDRARLFIFDLENKKMTALRVSHGRYGDTLRSNQVVSYNPKRNSVLKAVHFSNKPGSNATAGGFFITGSEYPGKYGRSLVLHGLEQNFNDNACLRATVIHQSSYVTSKSVSRMSSGCPMVADSKIDSVVSTLKNGSLLYAYTSEEAKLSEDTCGRNLL
jgi:hypothetical protein